MADLSLDYGEIVNLVELFKGQTAATDEQQAWALARVNEGLRRFIRGQFYDERGLVNTHAFSFLRPEATIKLWPTTASTADGAPAKDNGTSTVTADDAMFYDSMIGASVVFTATSKSYVIESVTSTLIAVVTGDASGEADEDVITVTSAGIIYMPENFGGSLMEPFVYVNDDETLTDLYERSTERIDYLYRDNTETGTPEYYAFQGGAVSADAIQTWQAKFHPITDTLRTLRYRYRVRVPRATDNPKQYPPGGSDFCDAIVACCLAAAEEKSGGKRSGRREAAANRAMLEAVALDLEMYGDAPQEHVEFSGDDTG